MSRPHTPTATLAARGSWRAKTRTDEPRPAPISELTPPADLDGSALETWHSMAPALIAAGLLTSADVPTFARYCRIYSAWSEAMRVVEEQADRHNVLTLAKLDEMLRKLEAGFGLSPSARTGVRVEKGEASGKGRFFESRAG